MEANSINVAVRIRPLSSKELPLLANIDPAGTPPFAGQGAVAGGALPARSSNALIRKVLKVLDDRVCVFDPPETSPLASYQKTLLGPSGPKKFKDIRFCFDKVFDEDAGQQDLFQGAASNLVPGVLDGFNATVFAYGATGCGKTHTISGSPDQPGIVFLLMKDLFDRIADKKEEMTVEVSISYLEIYNETIRDLLIPGTTSTLTMRENDGKVVVPGLSEQTPASAEQVVSMIIAANANRTVSATEANAVSSRSHAVLSVNVKQKARTAAMTEDYTMATLSVIDLAGSERASVTKNKGERLIEGANINRSLLALGNCINALCDPKRHNHVPYRDSKLTRLLKHSLGGNCRTLMIVCVSPSSHHYDETFNTLQYANRAKEIKTKVTRNVVSVDRHVSQYVRVIYELRQELDSRKAAEKDSEKRIRDAVRTSREAATAEVREAVAKVKQLMEDSKGKISKVGTLQAQADQLHQLNAVLIRWRAAVFPPDKPANPSYVYDIDNLLAAYPTRIQSLRDEISQAENAQRVFDATCASITRKLSNPLGSVATQQPELLGWLNAEVQLVQSQLSLEISRNMLVDNAYKRPGAIELVSALDSVKRKISLDRIVGSAASCDQRQAIDDMWKRLEDASGQLADLTITHTLSESSSTARAQPFLRSEAPLTKPLLANKRTSSMRSPLPIMATTSPLEQTSELASRPGKIHRSSTAHIVPAGGSGGRQRRSPKKVPLPSSQHRLMSRPSLKPAGSFGKTAAFGGAILPKKEGKRGVAWKDDKGDALTEEHTKSIIDFSDTSAELSGPSKDLVGRRQVFSAARPMQDLGNPSVPPISSSLKSPILEEDESLCIQSADGSSHCILDVVDVGNSLDSSTANSSFGSDTTAPNGKVKPLHRRNLAQKARSSIAVQGLTGTPRKSAVSRRVSAIGPIRSAKQNRRTSYIDPLTLNSLDNASLRSPGPTRRASRAMPLLQKKLSGPLSEGCTGSSRQARPAGGVDGRVAAARARRESQANMLFGSSNPTKHGANAKSSDTSLDLSSSFQKAPVWR